MKRRQSGFTLLEVLIALAVVAISVLSMIKSMNTHADVSGELEKSVLAGWVASNHLAELRYQAKIEKVSSGRDSESVRLGDRRWRVRTNIEKTDVEKVFLVTIEVSDADNNSDRIISSMTSALSEAI
ncbi:MAG: type II secretion system minor pseudopilin GspI [Gammaproteobacteria bacterium]|nr:type II secretion system minor pseudopilin GspI [Gammaproteobacteria bacterium]